MMVAELIEKLKLMPQDIPVIMCSSDMECGSVHIERVEFGGTAKLDLKAAVVLLG